mgnify:CR=1 FL=1
MSCVGSNPGRYVPQTSGSFFKRNNENTRLRFVTNYHDLHYRSNGSGRDTYVAHNNGGMQAHESPAQHLKSEFVMSGRMIPSPEPRNSPGRAPEVIHYKSDGKGRDSYICTTNGGLTFPNKPCDPRLTFSKNLRGYQVNQNYVEKRQQALASASGNRSVFGRLSLQMVSPREAATSDKKLRSLDRFQQLALVSPRAKAF